MIKTRPRDPIARFFAKVNKNGPLSPRVAGRCWEWLGTRNTARGGYGQVRMNKRLHAAHRFSYEITGRTIPDGFDLDHLCRNPPCVNPDHLQPVTRQVNLLRGETTTAANAAVTECPAGHAYDQENTYINKAGQRICRRCAYLRNKAARERRQAARAT